MKKNSIFVIVCFVFYLLSSCSSSKEISYFSQGEALPSDSLYKNLKASREIRFHSGDLLSILVSSELSQATTPFNLPFFGLPKQHEEQFTCSLGNLQVQTYEINQAGEVQMPVIGKIKLGGLKMSESIELINKKLEPYLKNPIVNIRLINYRITVLGEVKNPGSFSISNGRISVLEALGMAGDISPYGNRKNILIIRENNGKLEFGQLDLSSNKVFFSPYYYLQQNDVVYVPNR